MYTTFSDKHIFLRGDFQGTFDRQSEGYVGLAGLTHLLAS